MKHAIALSIMLLITTSSIAHDTTHIHPLITAKIAKSIEFNDSSAMNYEEVYELNSNGLLNYWGTDFAPAPGLSDDLTPYVETTRNTINGVVHEDVPSINVLDHFYHATSGIGLTLSELSGNPSSVVAMAHFNDAIDWYGNYTEDAKGMAFFEFGRSLHHVEDMSSPAHVHNDPHLTFYSPERDDYEGYYLPMQNRTTLNGYFSTSNLPQPINNPWSDIWGNNSNSMALYIHNITTYQATLEFPVADYSVLDAELSGGVNKDSVDSPTPAPLSASGELAKMFPCPGGIDENCLHWEEDGLNELAHWRIDAVGDFIHQYTAQVNPSEWWPIEAEDNLSNPLVAPMPDPSPAPFPNPFPSGRYYIEQLAKGNYEDDPVIGAVIPVEMRTDFKTNWSDANPSITNTTALWELYASNLLQPAVDYGAGFTQLWYDIANTPPYLKMLTVKQELVDSTVEKTVYSGEWIPWEKSTATQENDRFLQLSDINHIHNQKNITLELTFNEPIKQITQLLIGSRNITVPTSGDLDSDDKVWTIQVTPTVLAGLNGKVQLTVKATDKNKHTEGTDIPGGGVASEAGGELDGTPDTPARRNITFAQASIGTGSPVNYYPWYDKDNGTADDIAYSYDPENGDVNHWLVFDTSAPATTINVDLTLQ